MAFSSVENLNGGSGADTINIATAGSISGIIDGLGGSDTLSFSVNSIARDITIIGADASGFSGTDASIGGGFVHIDQVIGSTVSDSLHGVNSPASFALDTINTYTLGGNTLGFAGIENLYGGSGVDTFTVNGARTANLYGNGGADIFIFANNAILTGAIDASSGLDTLDFSAYTTPRAFVLTGTGSVDGFNGTTSAVSGGFSNVNIILGSTSSNADSLTGLHTASVFDLAAGTYTDTISARTLQFVGVETLVGGSAADTFLINGNTTHNLNGGAGNDAFVFNSNNQLNGWINGGLGSDTLNYQAYTEAVTVSFAAGTATAVSAGISGIENFLGSATASNTIYGDDNDNILVGGASNDTFYGLGGNDTYILGNGWGIDTIVEYANQGNDTLDFSAVTGTGITFNFDGTTFTITGGTSTATTNNYVENYLGTGQDDTFTFRNGAVVTGRVDGAAGHDTLDYTNYNSARNFVITALGSVNGFQGTEASILGGFNNMDELMGTSYATDGLTGRNADASWNITTGVDDLYSSGGRNLTYSAIERLTGGNAADTFIFANGATHDGSINGGAGTDLLDYQAYTSSVTVDLFAGTATGVSGTVSNMENVNGGSADDSLTGNGVDNVLNGYAGNDTIYGLGGNDTLIGGNGNDQLYGGAGNDTYGFSNGWGVDDIHETAGEGSDTLDFSVVTVNLTVDLNALTVVNGGNQVNFVAAIEALQSGSGNDLFNINANRTISLNGGAGNDQYVYSDGITLNGSINGQAGTDTINFSTFSTPRNVVLNGLGSVDGFNGSESALTGTFSNVDAILASSGVGDTFTGANLTATFELDGSDQYQSGGHSVAITGFETLNGGSGNDLFEIIGNRSYALNGGSGNDTFAFADNAVLTGILNGQSGTNTLDYSNYTTSRDINLTGYGSVTGFSGIEFSIIGSFTNINNVIGGSENDALSGTDDPGQWTINTTGGSYLANNRTMTFSSVETLNGSGYDDTFTFTDGAVVSGSIDGRGGSDTLNFTQYTTGIVATLLNGDVNVILAGVTSIENIIGGSGNDSLTGNNGDNQLDGGAGDDNIEGLGGNDTLRSGTGNNSVSGGDGDDIIFSGNGTNILYGGDGYDIGYIIIGSDYSVPLNDIESLLVYVPPVTPDDGTQHGGGTSPELPKPYRVLIVPVESGENVTLLAAGYDAMILRLPEGNQVFFSFLDGTTATLSMYSMQDFPVSYPTGTKLIYGLSIQLMRGGQNVEQTSDGMLISFVVPFGFDYHDLMIAFWDEALQTWVEIPSYYTAASSTDEKNRLSARVFRTGRYILALRSDHQKMDSNDLFVSLTLANGEVVHMACSGAGSLIATPQALGNLDNLSLEGEAIAAFTVHASEPTQTDVPAAGEEELKYLFPVTGGSGMDEYRIMYQPEGLDNWFEVDNSICSEENLKAFTDQGGTYVLILK